MTKLSRANLQLEDSTVLLQDNNTQDIEPSEHRQSNINIHESFLNFLDDNIQTELDGSLAYITDPTGAWDSSPTHDLKFVPKIYVDDKFSGTSSQFMKADGSYDSNTYVSSSALSSYAKLDGSNQPFTGQVKIQNGDLSSLVLKQGGSNQSLYFLDLQDSTGGNLGYIKKNGVWRSLAFYGDVIYVGNESSNAGSFQNNGGVMSALPNSNFQVRFGGVPVFNVDNSQNTATFSKAIVVGNSTSTTAGAIRFNTTTNKHQGYDGTTWNDLY